MRLEDIESSVRLGRHMMNKTGPSFGKWLASAEWPEGVRDRLCFFFGVTKLTKAQERCVRLAIKHNAHGCCQAIAHLFTGHVYCDAVRAANLKDEYVAFMLPSDITRLLTYNGKKTPCSS